MFRTLFRPNKIQFFENGKTGFDPVKRIYYDLNHWLSMEKSNIVFIFSEPNIMPLCCNRENFNYIPEDFIYNCNIDEISISKMNLKYPYVHLTNVSPISLHDIEDYSKDKDDTVLVLYKDLSESLYESQIFYLKKYKTIHEANTNLAFLLVDFYIRCKYYISNSTSINQLLLENFDQSLSTRSQSEISKDVRIMDDTFSKFVVRHDKSIKLQNKYIKKGALQVDDYLITFRGMKQDYASDIQILPNFTSTSINFFVALHFAFPDVGGIIQKNYVVTEGSYKFYDHIFNNLFKDHLIKDHLNPVVYIFKIPIGVPFIDLSEISEFQDEKEFLLPRNLQIQIETNETEINKFLQILNDKYDKSSDYYSTKLINKLKSNNRLRIATLTYNEVNLDSLPSSPSLKCSDQKTSDVYNISTSPFDLNSSILLNDSPQSDASWKTEEMRPPEYVSKHFNPLHKKTIKSRIKNAFSSLGRFMGRTRRGGNRKRKHKKRNFTHRIKR